MDIMSLLSCIWSDGTIDVSQALQSLNDDDDDEECHLDEPSLLEMIGTGLDFVFANESEALTISGSEEIESAIAYFKTIAKGFAITRGANGSLICARGSVISARNSWLGASSGARSQ